MTAVRIVPLEAIVYRSKRAQRAYEEGKAFQLERIIDLASQLGASIPADHPKGAQASFADYLRTCLSEQPQITVHKVAGYVQASIELMNDCAFDLNAVLNPTWRQRFRRRLYAFRGRMAEHAYRLIAGRDLPEPEPYDWDDDQ